MKLINYDLMPITLQRILNFKVRHLNFIVLIQVTWCMTNNLKTRYVIENVKSAWDVNFQFYSKLQCAHARTCEEKVIRLHRAVLSLILLSVLVFLSWSTMIPAL